MVDELVRALVGKAAVKRDHDELAHSQLADQFGLGVKAREQLRSRLGTDYLQRVRLEREHRVAPGDHLAVAEVDPVELADGHPAGALLNVG
jgi:hypothetical protein